MHTEDTSQHGERNTTMHDAMWRGHGGFEIALAPVLFGFFGWLLDGWLGTTPLLVVIGAIVGLGGSVTNQYYQYTARMELAAAERFAARKAEFAPADKRFSKNEMTA